MITEGGYFRNMFSHEKAVSSMAVPSCMGLSDRAAASLSAWLVLTRMQYVDSRLLYCPGFIILLPASPVATPT